MNEQLTLDLFLEQPAETPAPEIDFSCFAVHKVGKNGIRFEKCNMQGKSCHECEAFELFYEKAEEYYNNGEPWNVSVAMAREFFKIPTVPEYTVEAYKKAQKGREKV